MREKGIHVATVSSKSRTRGTIRHSEDPSMVGIETVFHKRESFENNIEGTPYYTMKLIDSYPITEDIIDQLKSRDKDG